MEKENLVLDHARCRLESFIKRECFDEDDLFDRAYRLGLEHALAILKDCSL